MRSNPGKCKATLDYVYFASTERLTRLFAFQMLKSRHRAGNYTQFDSRFRRIRSIVTQPRESSVVRAMIPCEITQ